MPGPISAKIDDSMIPVVIAENRLPIGISRAEVIRYCLARIAGLDHYDSLREAERPRLDSDCRARVQPNGLTSVSADIPADLLSSAMVAVGSSNFSQTIRYALAMTTGKLSADDAHRHSIAPAGKPVGRPRKQVVAA